MKFSERWSGKTQRIELNLLFFAFAHLYVSHFSVYIMRFVWLTHNLKSNHLNIWTICRGDSRMTITLVFNRPFLWIKINVHPAKHVACWIIILNSTMRLCDVSVIHWYIGTRSKWCDSTNWYFINIRSNKYSTAQINGTVH